MDEERGLMGKPLGKTARNEAIKLKATFINNVGVGVFIAGLILPFLAYTKDRTQAPSWSKEYWLLFFVLMIAGLIALGCRVAAHKVICKLED